MSTQNNFITTFFSNGYPVLRGPECFIKGYIVPTVSRALSTPPEQFTAPQLIMIIDDFHAPGAELTSVIIDQHELGFIMCMIRSYCKRRRICVQFHAEWDYEELELSRGSLGYQIYDGYDPNISYNDNRMLNFYLREYSLNKIYIRPNGSDLADIPFPTMATPRSVCLFLKITQLPARPAVETPQSTLSPSQLSPSDRGRIRNILSRLTHRG
jgi:hypothetical protein